MRVLALTALACLMSIPAATAGSRRCGDDTDGRGRTVPCDCGDVLVSSRTLGPHDPITQHACPGTGLLVDVAADRPAATLDLGGQTLVGQGRGIGIQVLGGGTGGLLLVGPGAIRGFDLGVLARGSELARASDVIASDNATDGFSLGGTGYAITRCEASRNGRDGFTLRGSGFLVEGNHAAQNRRFGFAVAGESAALGGTLGNEAAGNGRDGLVVRGRGHELVHPVATGNAGTGLRARFSAGRIAGAVAADNRRDGLRGGGRDLDVTDSEARDNGGAGIDVRGARVHDGGGNRARGNGHATAAARRRAGCQVGSSCR